MKRSRSEAVRAALNSYLERRNYTDCNATVKSEAALCLSAEQMAVSAIVDGESGRANSIIFSCINNDPAQCDQQFTKLVTYIRSVEPESIQDELSNLLCPLLCHMYLEMLRGGHRAQAQMFLKQHSTSLPQRDCYYNHQTGDGNLPSALYRPNSLERLFHSLQNGTIDNDIPEKDFIYQILDDLNTVNSLQELDARPSLAAFRSCKYELQMSLEAITCLQKYLAKHSHLILIQVLQTWFHFDIMSKDNVEESPHEAIDDSEEETSNELPNSSDNNDNLRLCNGHGSEFLESDNELRELKEAIQAVREHVPPVKLYTVSVSEASLTCAALDMNCKSLYCGFTNSEIRKWGVGGNETEDQSTVNGNISQVSLECNKCRHNRDYSDNISFDPSAGICLRGHSGSVQALKLIESADTCGVLVSASHDTTIRAWRLSDKSCAAIYRGHNYPIWCLDVAKHGVYMASGSYDRTVKLWSLDRTFPLRIFAGHNLDVNTISFHPNGNYLATGSADKTVRLWCVSTGQQVRLFPGHRGSVHCLAFSPDGKLIASAGEDKRIKIWDIATGGCLHDLKGHQAMVTNLEWSLLVDSNDNNTFNDSNGPGILLSTSMDSTLRLWDSTFYKYKGSLNNSESSSTVFTCQCSHLVMSRNYTDWFVAVGANLRKS